MDDILVRLARLNRLFCRMGKVSYWDFMEFNNAIVRKLVWLGRLDGKEELYDIHNIYEMKEWMLE